MGPVTDAIRVEGLVKRFGEHAALDGLDLVAAEGSVLGLLGPNGAGKTTSVRILTTLLRPDAGLVEVAGIDVIANPAAVRRRIGMAAQFSSLDYTLTGRENLIMFGRLQRLGRRQATKRADRLLESFSLTDVAGKSVQTYSGGMTRRLDLAAALVATPAVLFLDEPSTGLDPASRLHLWELLAELADSGVTLLLTTQYLEEADRLADQVAVVQHGRVIVSGTPDELKARVGGDRIDVALADPADTDRAVAVLRDLADGDPIVHDAVVGVPAGGAGSRMIAEVVRTLDRHGIAMLDISTHRPTLDDVFLSVTGQGAGA